MDDSVTADEGTDLADGSELPEGSELADPADSAADLPERPGATGDPRVDDAVALLDGVGELPSAERVGVFDDVQRRLHSALGSLDPATAE